MALITRGNFSAAPGENHVTILAGENLSDSVLLVGSIVRIYVPSDWDATSITFQISRNNTDWFNLYDKSGNQYSLVANSGTTILIPPSDFISNVYIKFRSGTANATVAQTNEQALYFVTQVF